MNAFKLDLMTVLALFVILAVIVTMALGANDDDKTSVGAFSQQKSAIASVINEAPANGGAVSYRASQAVLPTAKLVSSSWR